MDSIAINNSYRDQKKQQKIKKKQESNREKARIASSLRIQKGVKKVSSGEKVPKAKKCKLTYKSIMDRYGENIPLLIKEKNWIMKYLIKKADIVF